MKMTAAHTSLRLDHLVIAVHDLDQAMRSYRAQGYNVVVGGKHPGRLSHNALVVFADGSYFELITWSADAPNEAWWHLLQRQGEGLIDFALLPHSTAEVIQAARLRGLHIEGPIDGGRRRPDGRELVWTTGRQLTRDLPFLCGDVTPREWRVPEGELRLHPNGATGVGRVVIQVNDLAASVQRYRQLLGPDVASKVGSDHAEFSLDGGCTIELRHRPALVEGPVSFEMKSGSDVRQTA
jgi:catechol 2,3-dioxygenase-like lactoylglutathione lyase family enzyme